MGEEESLLMMAAAAGSSSSTASESSTDTAPHPPAHSRMSVPTRRSTKGGWTEEEDANLVTKVQLYKGKNWKKIAESFPGHTDVQCLHRWQKVLNPDLVKGPWTKEEDDHIMKLVKIYGPKKWSLIAKSLPGRIGKQCRERWHNHLNPSIKKDAWTEAEEFLLIRAHQIYGNKWAEIARFLPGRADNSIKNHWNCSVKKKLGSYEASGFLCPLPAFSTLELVLPRKEAQHVEVESDKRNERIVSNNGEVGQGDITDLAFVSTVATNESRVGQLFNFRLEEPNCLDRVQNNSHLTIDKLSRTTNDKRSTTTNGSVAEASDDGATILTLPSRVSLSEMSNEQIQMSRPSKLHPFSLLAQAKKIRNLDKNEDTGRQATARETKENKESNKVRSSCLDIPFPFLAQVKKNRILEQTGDSVGKPVGRETKESKESGKVRASCSNVPVVAKKSSIVVSGRPSPLDEACNLTNFDDLSVSGNSLESHPQLMKSPTCSTPDSCSTWNAARGGNSPVLFLRNAARTFRNTPSILRKRVRDDYSLDNNICTIEHRNYCMPEASSRGSKVPQSTANLSVNQDNHECLLVSSPASLKPEAATASERVEKCLESVFDMEWDKASAKCV